MNLNKFTEKAQEAILAAPQLASELNHSQVEPEHLLVALVEQPEASSRPCCGSSTPIPGAVAASAARAPRPDSRRPMAAPNRSLSPRLRVVLDAAQAEAKTMQDEFVSTEHLLLGILSEPGTAAASIR